MLGDSTLRRGVAVLAALGGDEAVAGGGLGVIRVSQLIGCDKSQASRTLKTLAELGLIERSAGNRAYHLGWQLYGLAAQAGDQRLVHWAPHFVRRLATEVDESSYVAVLHRNDVFALYAESCHRAIQSLARVGHRVPAACTASGRILLCELDGSEIERVFLEVSLDGHARGPNAPRSVEELITRARAARRHGYAVADEELEPGHVSVAAPVRDVSGNIVAALGLSAPKRRIQPRISAVVRTTVLLARELSAALGAPPRQRRAHA